MENKLYVGNLPYGIRDLDLLQAFSQFGAVVSTKVMMERETGRSKGFGFVEMGCDSEASAAIHGMHGQPLGGRSLVVNKARPLEPRSSGTSGYRQDFQAASHGGGYAGKNEGGFRSPYETGPRNRQNMGHNQSQPNGKRYRNEP